MASTVIPCLTYEDAPAMIDWLCETFGFTRHEINGDGNGGISHAELRLGDGMIMLGSASNQSAWSEHAALPDEVGGRQTQSACVIVTDADAMVPYLKEWRDLFRGKAQGIVRPGSTAEVAELVKLAAETGTRGAAA